jgi:CheY-like chemotaxis protein
LTNAGWEAVVAEDGPQAIERVRGRSFDAVLCDHRLDGMSGPDVHAAIAALRPEVAARFVLMSGDVSDPELRAFAAPHGIELLAKPFALEAVMAAVRAVVGREAPQSRG